MPTVTRVYVKHSVVCNLRLSPMRRRTLERVRATVERMAARYLRRHNGVAASPVRVDVWRDVSTGETRLFGEVRAYLNVPPVEQESLRQWYREAQEATVISGMGAVRWETHD